MSRPDARRSTPVERTRPRPEGPVTDVRAALDAALEGGPERHREEGRGAGEAAGARAGRAAARSRTRWPRRACSPTGSRRAWAPTAWSPGWARSAGGRVALMANDPAVKAGSWGPKTVEKILRIQERALAPPGADRLPRGLRGGADHRPGADVPGRPRRRAHLPQRRCASRARCPRSACCSGRAPPAAPTSPPSATS